MKETRVVILGLLAKGDLYGYQIKKQLQEQELEWATIPVASLYHELNRLAEEQLIQQRSVESSGGRPARAVYGITADGRAALREALLEAWVAQPARRPQQDIAAYLIDLLPPDELSEALERRIALLEIEAERIQALASQKTMRPGARPTMAAVIDHARSLLAAELGWTRDLLRRVASGEFASVELERSPSPAALSRRAATPKNPVGAFTFVLHSHLPYCRLAGRWPHGEEWLHEAIAETYVPLLIALYDLRDEAIPFRITIGLTPVLVEQLADVDVRDHFLQYIDKEIAAAEADIPRFGEEELPHLEYLAGYYRDTYRHIRSAYLERFNGDIIAAFCTLQDEGFVEIVTCGATHGYLPLLERDSSIYGQLRTAVASYHRHFGRQPRAIWLPECAYRPAYVDSDGVVRPAIEEFLAPLGISCFFVETHAIEGGRPVGKAGEEVSIGPYGAVKREYVLPTVDDQGPGGTTFVAYHVVGNTSGVTEPPVSAIGRNNRTGQQVWSASLGYPGDADYREFHRKDHVTGLQYWRVTGANVDLGAKDLYHPDWAEHKVAAHASHYAELVEQLLVEYHQNTGRFGLVASNYDTELFGHWWFEGIEWIKQVLAKLSDCEQVELTTASAFIAAHPPQERIALPESSWGAGGNHWTWDNPDTHWMWEPIHKAERRMEELAARCPAADGDLSAALNQAARELLLIESSDWTFLVTTGQAKQYAIERFHSHLERFELMAAIAERGAATEQERELIQTTWALDNLFPDIDYRWFAPRQGRAK
jgi:1,4-alpha-glucan branching enzyme